MLMGDITIWGYLISWSFLVNKHRSIDYMRVFSNYFLIELVIDGHIYVSGSVDFRQTKIGSLNLKITFISSIISL